MKISKTIFPYYKSIEKKAVFAKTKYLCKHSQSLQEINFKQKNIHILMDFIHRVFSKKVVFARAESISEVQKFAKNYLGYNFRCFNYLEQANLINEQFSLIKNIYPKIKMPDNVDAITSLKGGYAKFMINHDTGKTKIIFDNYPIYNLQKNKAEIINNSSLIYSSDRKLHVHPNISFDTKEKFEMLINKLQNRNDELTLSDYYQIALTLRSLKNLEIQKQEIPLFFIKNIVKAPQNINKLKTQNIIIDLNRIEKEPKEEQYKLLLNLEKKLDIVYTPWISRFEQIVVHELAHLMCYQKSKNFFNRIFSTLENSLHKKFESKKEIETAMQVSPYATKSPFEFVAEVFSHNFFGRKFSDEVLKLYEKYKGPKLLN